MQGSQSFGYIIHPPVTNKDTNNIYNVAAHKAARSIGYDFDAHGA
jgi:hypothetical protein